VSPRLAAAALATLLLVPARALAHQAGLSYGALAVDGDHLDLSLRISAAELAASWPELAAEERVRDGAPDLAREVLGSIAVTQGSATCASTGTSGRLEAPDTLALSGSYRCPRGGEPVRLRLGFVARMPPGHVHLAKVVVGGRVEEHVVDARRDGLEILPLASGWARAARFVALGVEHIFTGLDHVAFLVGLLLAGGGLREVLRVVTGFTAAHALTLALATLGVVSPPAALVEPLIAASVAYVGLESLLHLLREKPRPERRWPIAFAFGLVHGFGFAGALRELDLPGHGLAVALLSFNVGVELGQAAIVTVAFPLLARLRRQPRLARAALPVGSLTVGAAGLVWLVERVPWR
jgi:hydrogenase/urease accessory protein HupE